MGEQGFSLGQEIVGVARWSIRSEWRRGLLAQSIVVKKNNRLFSDWGSWRQKPRQEPIVDEDKV